MSDKKLGIKTNSLQTSLYALEGGADGIIFCSESLKDIDLLRKLKRYCSEKGKRFCLESSCLILYDYLEPDVVAFDAIIDAVDKSPDFAFWTAKSLMNPSSESAEKALKTITDGIKTGTIRKVMKGRAEIVFSEPVALKDTLCVSGVSFYFENPSNGRSFVSAGESVEIDFPTEKFDVRPVQGTDVLCTGKCNTKLGRVSEDLPLYSKPVDIEILLKNGSFVINGIAYEVEVQKATNSSDFIKTLEKVFQSNNSTMFCLGKFDFINESAFENPFIPISSLKTLKRNFYKELENEFYKNAMKYQENLSRNEIC